MKNHFIHLTVVLAIFSLVMVNATCTSTSNSNTTYKMTHSAADAEHILSWQSIVSKCPDLGNYDKIEAFVVRGQTKEIAPGETVSLGSDSLAAWASTRFVRTNSQGGPFRSFSVEISFFETDVYLDEYEQVIETSGFPLQKEGDFMIGTVESGPPMQSLQILIAGKYFAVSFLETASSGEALFCAEGDLMSLLPGVQSNITSIEVTPLPSNIPERGK